MFFGNPLWNYNPWTNWMNFLRGATEQIGLINIDVPPTERKIIREVGSYGKQLGKIIDVLCVLVGELDHGNLNEEDRKTLKDFLQLVEKIEKCKREEASREKLKIFLEEWIEDVG